jgi:hypothetical protein
MSLLHVIFYYIFPPLCRLSSNFDLCKLFFSQVSKTEGFQRLAQAFPQIMAELFAHVRSSHYLDPSDEKGTTYPESSSSKAPKTLNAVPESAVPWSEAAQSQGAVKNSVEKKEDGGGMEKWMGDIQGNLSRDIGEHEPCSLPPLLKHCS